MKFRTPTLAGIAMACAAAIGHAFAPLSRADVVLSEIMSDNEATLEDEDGEFSDWIELHNNGPDPVDLVNYWLTDDAGDLTGWQFEAVTLGPDSYLVIFASDKDRSDPDGELHTDFRLNASIGEYLALVAPDGKTVVSEFAPQFPFLADDTAYGRVSGADQLALLVTPTPGAENSGAVQPVMIDSFTASPDTIPAGDTVTLSWSVQNATGITISSLASALPASGSLPVSPPSSRSYTLRATNPLGTVSATVDVSVGPDLRSFTASPSTIAPGGRVVLRRDVRHALSPRLGDGFGPLWNETVLYTPFNITLLPKESDWRYLDDGSNQGTAWREPVFDDAAWASGPAPLGHGNGTIATVVSENLITAYFRRSFDVPTPETLRGLSLRMRHDDGAVAYLNGVEIARSRMLEGVPVFFDTPPLTNVFGTLEDAYVEFPVDASLLAPGANVLSIEIHNSPGSPDLIFDAALTAWQGTAPSSATLTLTAENEAGSVSADATVTIAAGPPPPPATLVITEFAWDFAGALDGRPHRFVEILNTGSQPVDLAAGVQTIGGAWFDFADGAIPVLQPDEYAIVAASVPAFQENRPDGLPVAGAFGIDGANHAPGPTLGLLDAHGTIIEYFPISGPVLPPDPFRSFERIDVLAPPDFPANWRVSTNDYGSPGEAAAPVIVDFTTSRSTASAGDVITLSWNALGAQSVRIEPGVGDFFAASGSIEIPILFGEGSRTYTLTATGVHASVHQSLNVIVAPEILAFDAHPRIVNTGETLVFSWEVTTDDVLFRIDPGIGSVGGNAISIRPEEDHLVGRNSEWRYLDDNSDQGLAWVDPFFNDAAWPIGIGNFGYGNDNEHWLINSVQTAYFRKPFEVHDATIYGGLFVDLLIDDGARVFLNGTEILRDNLPEGAIDFQTRSLGPSPTDGREYTPFPVDHTRLVTGTNFIAVDAHNNTPQSDDFGFDLGLRGVQAPTAGPTTYMLTATNAAGTASAGLTVLFNHPRETFGDWAVSNGISDADRHVDEEGDGLVNLVEFTTGKDPLAFDGTHPLVVSLDAEGRATVAFTRNLAAEGATVGIEVSRDLLTWSSPDGHLVFSSSIAQNGSLIAETRYRSALPVTGDLYVRLVVAEP